MFLFHSCKVIMTHMSNAFLVESMRKTWDRFATVYLHHLTNTHNYCQQFRECETLLLTNRTLKTYATTRPTTFCRLYDAETYNAPLMSHLTQSKYQRCLNLDHTIGV